MIQNFYEKISERPDDFELRSVFADWLFDNEFYNMQKVQLFLIENKRNPIEIEMQYVTIPKKRWIFGRKDNNTYNEYDNIYYNCLLEQDIFDFSNKSEKKITINSFWVYFKSCQEAEESLCSFI